MSLTLNLREAKLEKIIHQNNFLPIFRNNITIVSMKRNKVPPVHITAVVNNLIRIKKK